MLTDPYRPPLNRTTQYWYDEPGAGSSGCGGCGSGLGGTGSHLTTVILPSGKTTRFNYDLAWRKIGETVGYNTTAAATTGYGYDAANNVTSTTDGRSKVTAYAYDNRNRRTSTTDPLNPATSRTYDAAGNVLTETRADNGVTAYVYDPMNRRTKATDPLNQVTQMAYDGAGNLQTLTDARNNAYGFTYDSQNRKTQMSYPGGSHEDWTYDAAGNTSTYTTRAGQVETLSYDSRNRQTLADWSDATPDVSQTHDGAGRLLTLNNSASALTYTYDSANELLTETQDIADGPGAQTLTYTYDLDGNRASLTYPDGHAITYAYTARNQVSTITADNPPPLVTYTYDLAGNRTAKALENGTDALNVFDDANRLTSITDRSAGTTFASFAYTYNAVNNRTSVTRETGLGDAYGYDVTDQLTGVQYDASNPSSAPSSPAKTQGFAYDATGNRTNATENSTATSYSANNLNQYTAIGSTAPTYDANGNMLSEGSSSWVYQYDAQNRLIHGAASGATFDFSYDGRNRCVKRKFIDSSTKTKTLVYDRWSLILEADRNGTSGNYTPTARYVHGATIDEILVKTDANGSVYYHQDALHSTTHLTNGSGVIVESYRYDAFGLPTIHDGSGTLLDGGSAQGNRFLFTGRERMADLGWYDYRNRAYSPGLGRFLQADPLRFKAIDNNLYRYASNAPLNWTDPLGLDPEGASVECDGRGNVRVGDLGIWGGEANKDCVRKHELQHADDYNKYFPNICKDPKTGVPLKAGTRINSLINPDDPYYQKIHAWSECQAFQVEAACECDAAAKLPRGGRRDLMNVFAQSSADSAKMWCEKYNDIVKGIK